MLLLIKVDGFYNIETVNVKHSDSNSNIKDNNINNNNVVFMLTPLRD